MQVRKFITAFFISAILVPSISFAQTSPTRDELTTQLIASLLQQIKILQARLASLQANSVYDSSESEKLSISSKNVEVRSSSARISWETSTPSETRVIYSKSRISSDQKAGQRELVSENGTSTNGVVNIKNLESNSKYYYQIKATTRNSYVYSDGTFVTAKSPEQILNEKEAQHKLKENKQRQTEIAEQLKAIEDECKNGCYYGLNYQRDWDRLNNEMNELGGTYEARCIYDVIGNREAISPGSRHLVFRCIGWGG